MGGRGNQGTPQPIPESENSAEVLNEPNTRPTTIRGLRQLIDQQTTVQERRFERYTESRLGEIVNVLNSLKNQSDVQGALLSKINAENESLTKELERIKEDFDKQVGEAKVELANQKSEAKGLRDELAQAKGSIQDSKLGLVETLGVAVALFTFVSVDFQLLKGAPNYYLVTGLVVVLSGLLLGFVVMLDFLIDKYRDFTWQKIILPILLLGVAATSVFCGLSIVRQSYDDVRPLQEEPTPSPSQLPVTQ